MGNCFLYKRGFGGGFGGGGGGSTPEVGKTASGKVISILDSMEKPLKGLRLFGKTTQNGTPTPDAPVPLESVGDGGSVGVTVCGKNLFNVLEHIKPSTINGITQTVNNDGSITFAGTLTESKTFGFSTIIFGENVRKVFPISGYYTLSVPVRPNNSGLPYVFINMYYNGKTHNNVFVCNAGNNFSYTREITEEMLSYDDLNITIGFWTNSPGTWTNGTYAIQLEVGTILTAYEPYKEIQTLPISTPNGLPGIHVSEGGNYTDENGWQWICDEVDFGRGKYIQRVLRIANYNGETIPGAYMSSTGALTTGATVLYALASPIETPLTSQELAQYAALYTYDPSTTIYNDADSYMEVKYMAKGG